MERLVYFGCTKCKGSYLGQQTFKNHECDANVQKKQRRRINHKERNKQVTKQINQNTIKRKPNDRSDPQDVRINSAFALFKSSNSPYNDKRARLNLYYSLASLPTPTQQNNQAQITETKMLLIKTQENKAHIKMCWCQQCLLEVQQNTFLS